MRIAVADLLCAEQPARKERRARGLRAPPPAAPGSAHLAVLVSLVARPASFAPRVDFPLEAAALLLTVATHAVWGGCAVADLRRAVLPGCPSPMPTLADGLPDLDALLDFNAWSSAVLRSARPRPFVLLAALAYLDRLSRTHLRGSLGKGTERHAAAAALVLASKWADDGRVSNRAWEGTTGLPAGELTRLEVACAAGMDWRLAVSEADCHRLIRHSLVGSGAWALVLQLLGDPSLDASEAGLRRMLTGGLGFE
ncbi:hypothetical protein DFJ74DRAFT_752119 [Hyaloraphidium curvatum]|nr:hypothetical protein DFJ74DRAFT_752119 [Hyaloraphidium curvatum]